MLNPFAKKNTDTTETIEDVGKITDPLALKGIDDADLVDIVDQWIENTRSFYKKEYDLYEVRKRNEIYRFGRQVNELIKGKKLKEYEAHTLDNVIYEIERTQKPLALSSLPDLIVSPGNNTDASKALAKMVTQVVNSDLQKEENRKVLGMAWQHRPVYRVGVIKCIWLPEAFGGLGDYKFIFVHPDAVEVDPHATEADADMMEYIPHRVSMTVKRVMMMFPKSKEKFIEELKKQGVMGKDESEPSWKSLATPIDIREVWFTDYEPAEEGKWKRVEGVLWKYRKCLLGKMKNPYFDYEGEQQTFSYENPQLQSSRRKLSVQEMQQSMVTGQFPPNVTQETVYHNFFDSPKKPFFFMVYDQWGKQPLDETTHLEQNIYNQDALDSMNKQIQETLKKRGHHIWSKQSGLTAAMIKQMDHNNPNEDYIVNGIPTEQHEFIPPERPEAQEFQDLDRIHDRMYALASATSIRGEVQDEAVTNNQIGRESNYTVMDDMVEDTINKAAQWMAGWAMHMIKTRYTKEHFRKILGDKGEWVFLQVHQDFVEDGQSVMIKASGTDKLRKQNNALNLSKMGQIDPLSLYEDMDLDDPEGRTAKMVAFKTDMPLYLSAFVETAATSTPELAQKLMAITQQGTNVPGGGGPAGQQPNPNGPGAPATNNTQAVAANPQQQVAPQPQV
jgi:hypothetical protein